MGGGPFGGLVGGGRGVGRSVCTRGAPVGRSLRGARVPRGLPVRGYGLGLGDRGAPVGRSLLGERVRRGLPVRGARVLGGPRRRSVDDEVWRVRERGGEGVVISEWSSRPT